MQNIIINGSIRSGTTWLLDTLTAYNKFYPIFEPDNTFQDAIDMKLRYRYLDPEEEYPEVNNFFKKLFNNKAFQLNRKHNLPKKIEVLLETKRKFDYKFIYNNKTPIIKFTRGHLFLNYLKKNFNTKNIIIFRHPLAVANSAFRKSYTIAHYEEIFDERQHAFFEKYPEYYDKVQKALKLLSYSSMYSIHTSTYERHMKIFLINWFFVNTYLLNEYKANNNLGFRIFYENLFMKEIDGFKEILNFLNMNNNTKILSNVRNLSHSSNDSNNIYIKKSEHLQNPINIINNNIKRYYYQLIDIFENDIYTDMMEPNSNSSLL